MDTIATIRHSRAAVPGEALRPAGQRGFVGSLVRLVSSLARWIGHLLERRRGRLALLEMTDDQLKDIGISRCDAHREGIRRFWE
ncbi:DUF1127 domain-containing protein [Mesorhizobium loti]|uniref:DUF1127 domain-containing protein n=1 Tax=Mesorhizobium jarvisii TaxID=1777867 RepID=A0A6M7TJV9_9HYPH|nr:MULTISPECIES: DUF1127 domain-containing protein [Mesorhizobium]OBQ68482.1 hypothetical protein A9K72_09570 [Mesorhizobium loti]QKC65100.1 DUF1127 domain-containing protein [Mesorhizobium jarvisii]QKD11014.1 DUF1127 domain-containing protein [Mesorhizobium loti]RJT31180.1 DUF1127 domain-containing protein [Mesorhizobium jarvisii]BCH02574.1 hypothetical protein MesoLj131b_45730 [Mesorhizobium sp. 131-2-5]